MQNMTLEKKGKLQSIIKTAWEDRSEINTETEDEIRNAVDTTLQAIDDGSLRVATPASEGWIVNEWVKKAILLSFRLNDNEIIDGGPATGMETGLCYDKVLSKFQGWRENDFKSAGFRTVPGCFVRRGSYIAKNVILMPSFVNLGAYIGQGSMIDTWATVGRCAKIGKYCHISGGAGIGGVLEPLQAAPVIIEDNLFIGARSEIAEGVLIKKGSVISMGVYIGASTKIIDRETGEVFYGYVPEYSVVVPGSVASQKYQSVSLYCAVIVKRVDEKTRSKTSLNDLLRD